MRKFLLGFFAAIFLPIILLLPLFLFVPKLHFIHGVYSTIPTLISRYYLIESARSGLFDDAVTILNRQGDLAELLGNNKFMQIDLTNNTYYIMKRAKLHEQYAVMLPWLERLVKLAPNNYLAKLMYAEAQAEVDYVNAHEIIREVRDIAPAHDRMYRLVVENSIRNGDNQTLKEWYEKYFTAQLAGFEPVTFPPATFFGQDVGTFLLEIVNPKGDTILISHPGFQLNEMRQYEFNVPRAKEQQVLKLHFITLPGVKIIIDKIVFLNSEGETIYDSRDINIVLKDGFMLSSNEALVTSYKGDVLTLIPADNKKFPSSDVIVFSMEFSRLPFSNNKPSM
jgi:hypothetical protein|tara:strand:+ start:324 stop:1334 length:1011 start_codon:yes stop_codon:yes gene_type:complete